MILSPEDEILINRELTADRARADSAMDTLPSDWKDGKIIETYELGTKNDPKPIKCSLPGRHPHGKGAIVETPSGALFRAGNQCAAREFEAAGANWAVIANKAKEDKKRQSLLRDLAKIERQCMPALEFLRSKELKNRISEVTETTAEFRSRFQAIKSSIVSRNMPYQGEIEDEAQMTKLREAHQRSLDEVSNQFEEGGLTEQERDKKLAAIRSSWSGRRIMKKVTLNYCPQDFRPDILVTGKMKIKRLEESEIALARAYRKLQKMRTGVQLNKDLQRIRDTIRSVARDWIDAAAVFDEFNVFFSFRNLSVLRLWSQQKAVDFDIEIVAGALCYSDASQDVTWQLPTEVSTTAKQIDALVY